MAALLEVGVGDCLGFLREFHASRVHHGLRFQPNEDGGGEEDGKVVGSSRRWRSPCCTMETTNGPHSGSRPRGASKVTYYAAEIALLGDCAPPVLHYSTVTRKLTSTDCQAADCNILETVIIQAFP